MVSCSKGPDSASVDTESDVPYDGSSDGDTGTDSDADADGDTDSDSDADADADADADSDADTDADADTDTDMDSDTDADAETDADRIGDTETAADSDNACPYACVASGECRELSGEYVAWGACSDDMPICCNTGANRDSDADTVSDTDTGADTVTDTDTGAWVDLEWTNPIVSKRADPHVFLHSDGYYYLAATVPEYDRIELRRAATLGGLSTAEPKVVWRRHLSGEMAAHIWAPEIHFLDGAWYLYFTAGRSDDVWAIRMYALENASANPLEGDWTEKGRIQTNWDSFSLDATLFEHGQDRYYLWTQRVPNVAGTSILISRMSSPTTLSGPQVVLSSPEFGWEQRGHEVNEAPAVLVKNGKIFVTFSASATDANYCMGLLTANADADLLDPASWTKSAAPVFQSNDETSQYGPGHNSFTTSLDGSVDILVYHARNYKDIPGEPLNNPDRAIRAQILSWNPDGTPGFGIPVADGLYSVSVPSR